MSKFFQRLLIVTIALYFIKTAFWPLTYFFLTGYTLLIVLFLVEFKWKFYLRDFLQNFFPPIILFLIICFWSLENASFKNEIVRKDLVRLLILFSLFYLLFWNKIHYKTMPVRFAMKFVIYLIAVIAVINLLKNLMLFMIPSEILSWLNISEEMALADDYNFFTLIMLLGIVLLNYRKNIRTDIGLSGWMLIVINFVVTANVIISGSRRGILALIVLIAFYLVSNLILQKTNSTIFLKRSVAIILLLLIPGILLFKSASKDKITNAVVRYGSLFGINDKVKIERFLWKSSLKRNLPSNYIIDKEFFKRNIGYWFPIDADGTEYSTVVTPYGKGVYINRGKSPHHGGISFYYDGPRILYYANQTYEISFKIKCLKGTTDSFSVGWYIPAGDGIYDMTKPLSLIKEIEELESGWYQCTSSYRFADNHIEADGFINSVLSDTEFIIADFVLRNLSYQAKFPKFLIEIRPDTDPKAFIDQINPVLTGENVIPSEPVVAANNKSNERFYADRWDRLLFSLELWRTKYGWYNKLFGHGFDYLKWFGEKYIKTPAANDWPHNPFVTILLYSGIIGLLSYLWLLIIVIRTFIKYNLINSVLFTCMLLTFYFSFFSGGNPFDPPIMGFFIMIPFLIKSKINFAGQIDVQDTNNR